MLDRYIGNTECFPILSRWDYFNHAGTGPWPRPVMEAVHGFVDQFGTDCFQSRNWDTDLDDLRRLLGRLIHADAHDIALIRNTGDGISLVASGIGWRPGDRIVSAAVEYPSNVYPWMDACQRHGLELVQIQERADSRGVVRVEEAEILAACEHPRTRVLAISHVQWASGQRMDLDRLGAFCRQRGILFVVDVIQSLGVVPVDVERSKIDVLLSGGHKWLLAPPGAGLLYCRRDLIETINPPTVGWLSVVNPYQWELNFERREDAGRFEVGTHAYPSLIGMKAAVELLLDAGVDAINAQVRALGDRFAAGAAAKGYTVVTDRAGDVGGAVCFTSPTHKPGTIVHDLRDQHRIEIATRSGRLRFAPHFYNMPAQVDRLINALPDH